MKIIQIAYVGKCKLDSGIVMVPHLLAFDSTGIKSHKKTVFRPSRDTVNFIVPRFIVIGNKNKMLLYRVDIFI